MDDVGGVTLSQPGPQCARSSERAYDTALAFVTLSSDLVEQQGGVFVGSGRVDEDAMDGPDAGHNLAKQGGETGELLSRVFV